VSVVGVGAVGRTGATFSVDTILRVGGEKDVSCLKNRKGSSACQGRLDRHYESVVCVDKTKRTVATFSVDIIWKIGRVRRIVPVLTTGKVITPVNVDLIGTTRVLFV
jgi:hypothetical protein